MQLENCEMHLPSYSIGDDIYKNIGPVCCSYGKTVLIIGGKKALAAVEKKIRQAVAEAKSSCLSEGGYGVCCWWRQIVRYQ